MIDGLAAAHIHGEVSSDFELMTGIGELLAGVGGDPVFDQNVAA